MQVGGHLPKRAGLNLTLNSVERPEFGATLGDDPLHLADTTLLVRRQTGKVRRAALGSTRTGNAIGRSVLGQCVSCHGWLLFIGRWDRVRTRVDYP